MTTHFKNYIYHHYIFLLALLIIIQSILLIFTFSCKRQGFHSDENWSYGYANSYYQSNIFQDSSKNPINFDEWKSSSILRDYIEVSENQRFRFDSVFYNMCEDYSPPLHSLILHGICSFFPNSFSWWYGFSINIIAFIISQFLLFFVAKKIFQSLYLAFLTCAFYGFSVAAINCFIYIRTYGLLTCLALAFIYLLLQLQNPHLHVKKYFFLIYFITILGCLSHYFFYAFAFFLSFAFGLQLLFQKNFQLFIKYVVTMILAVISALLIFPSTIHMVSSGQSLYAKHMPLLWEIKYCINLIFLETFGFIPKYPTPVTWCILKFICIFIIIILAGFLFLFRNEKWLKDFFVFMLAKIHILISKLQKKKKNIISLWPPLIFCFTLTLILIAKISNVYVMNIYTDRYLFFLVPIFDLCTIKILDTVFRFILKHRIHVVRLFLSLLLATSLLLAHSNSITHYYFTRNTSAPTITSLTKNANVIVSLKSNWHYVCYTTLLRDSKNIFVCCPNSEQGLDYLKSSLENLNNNAPVYLIMEKASLGGKKQSSGSFKIEDFSNNANKLFTSGYSETDLINFFSSCSWATSKEYVQTEHSFQGELVIYHLR